MLWSSYILTIATAVAVRAAPQGVVSQISDGQVQAPATASTIVSQASDGQPQASASASASASDSAPGTFSSITTGTAVTFSPSSAAVSETATDVPTAASSGGLSTSASSSTTNALSPASTFYPNHTNSGPVSLSINTQGGGRNATSPILYGWMIEDISHSIEGGLYGELLVNRQLQGSSFNVNPVGSAYPTLEGYHGIGNVTLALDLFHPLTPTVQNALQVTIGVNATGEVGFKNDGWWGMQVLPQTYNVSTYLLGGTKNSNISQLTFSIRSNLTGETFVSQTVPTGNLSTFNYAQFATQLENTVTAPNSNNSLYVTFDASEAAGNTVYFTFNSLFGETFKGRANGIRKDLGEAVYDLKPKFLRFPGGNNIEGQSYATRWVWNETIGPLINRKPRPGDWGYWNTNGFGFLEFLEWCEDMEMEPVMAIYAGYSLDGNSVPEADMGMVLQAALDQIEYVIGDSSTTWGAQRIADGHPEPFELNYIELGNEDWFSPTYPYRFPILYNGIKAKYPHLTLISTAYNEAPSQGFNYNISLPEGSMWDTHHYEEPQFFYNQFNFFDNWQEKNGFDNVTIFVGEYSVFQDNTATGSVNYSDPTDIHVFYPQMVSALGEGVYLLAMERNPNTVKMSSYAPSLANLNNYAWTPNLVTFTANPNDTILSVSYYLEQLFSTHHGTETLPVTNSEGDFNPLYWAAAIEGTTESVYLKVINTNSTAESLSVSLDAAYSKVNGSIITSPDPIGFNFENNKTAISTQPISGLTVSPATSGSTFQWTVPAYSVSVIQFDI